MQQLEAKIETGRHNFKIKMDKDLNVLQKEINLHVSDIKRIQGLMSRLAIKKGETNDELRRHKDKARKTMKQLKNTKKVGDGSSSSGGGGQSGTSPDKNFKTGGGFNTTAGSGAFNEDSPINLLLFGNSKKSQAFGSSMMTSSMGGVGGATMGSNSTANSNYINVILPLKNIIKTC